MHLPRLFVIVALLLKASPVLSQPVISEIHYHPLHAALEPEPLAQEWIEIHNPATAAVNVSGWQFSRGVSFVIPPGTTIPAGGYLVVAADPAAFSSAYPAYAGQMAGGWSGKLSNSGEAIRLDDAIGNEIDTVDYSDEGDWAVRGRGPAVTNWAGHRGWDWFTGADGLGKTKELVSVAMRKNTGQNWKDSLMDGGTPGATNSVNAANAAPVILAAMHEPQIPRSTEAVTVSCKVSDEAAALPMVKLRWRLDGAAVFGTLPMTDPELDGTFSATIPAQLDLAIVEWYLEASDATSSRPWPSAARTSGPGVVPEVFAQSCNALYQVDNSNNPSVAWTAGAQPVYRFILTAVERAELKTIQEQNDSQGRQINAAMNGTFIATDGTGQDTRYRCSVRNRGYSSRSGPPNNFSLSFVAGEEWAGRASFQMNCRYPHAAVCAAAIFQLGGMPVQNSAPAQLRLNGLNPAISGQGVGMFAQSTTYGSLARIEALGGDWAANHFPRDDEGNLYRVDDHDTGNSTTNGFRYVNSTNPDLYDDIYLKQTNQDENDYSDLSGLFRALNDTSASPSQFAANLRQHCDVEQWLTYIALDSLTGNMEGGLTTGRVDDFSLYRGVTDPRFVLVPHDLDTTMGQNVPSGLSRSIFSHLGIAGLTRLFNEPEFLHLYYRKNVGLCDTVFTRARLDPVIDDILRSFVRPASVPAGDMKNFVSNRRSNVLAQIPRVNAFTLEGVTTANPTQIDGMPQTPDGTATFSGNFNVAAVQSVLLNGQPTTLQWRSSGSNVAGRWVFSATAANGFLKRGPNRVTAVYYSGMNATGNPLYTSTVDIYNAAGSVTPVNADGGVNTVLQGNIQFTAPATYLPGIPFLVGVEYRTADNKTDPTQWTKQLALTANNGVSLTSASTGGGAAVVRLYNGRGSLLVNAGGGASGAATVLLNGRSTAGSSTPSTAEPAAWRYYTGTAAPVTNWFQPATVLPGWGIGPPIFYRAENGLTGTEITTTTVGWALRTTFNVTNPAQYASAKIRVQRDDGLKIYLNGTFLAADGLLENDSWSTSSTGAIANAQEAAWLEINLPIARLVNGNNTIAIEVHNNALSTDQRLNCEITAVPMSGGPVDPGNFTISGTVDGLTATRAITSLGLMPAMTTKTGTLPGSETWSGVINVTDDVTVPPGAVLTISPGTHVLMNGTAFGSGGSGGADLIVNGALSVPGTQGSPVSITCANPANRWGEINFNSATPGSLQFCHISRAGHSPAGGHTNTGPILRLAGTTLTVEDSILSDSPGKTMVNSGNANVVIRRSNFARCVMGPELDGSAINIQDSLIADMLAANRESGSPDDEDSIYIHDSGGRPVLIQRCVFANCGDDNIDLLGGSVTVEDSIVRNAFDKGISALSNNVTLLRCQLVDNDIGFSAKITAGQETRTFTNTIDSCTIVCENHPANTGDGSIHSIGCHTRNKNNTASANIIWNVRNTVISAEEPVANDYPVVGSTLFGGMNFSYSCFHDQGGTLPSNSNPTGTGNITVDPLFAAPGAKNFRLSAASPCRNTGDPSMTDADGTRLDMGALPFTGNGPAPTNIVWTLSGSPYRISQSTTIAAGSTLNIEAGVNVYFDQNIRLTVRGRMLALGTEGARIRFSHVPGTSLTTDIDPLKNGTQTGAPKWGGIRIFDSPALENQFRYCDFINAQGTDPATAENYGSLGFIRSQGWADHLTFAGTHLRMLYGRNCSLTVTHCDFPDMFLMDPVLGRIEIPTDFLASADNRMEPLKVEFPTTDAELTGQTSTTGTFPNGLPRNGHWRVYYNDFHGNRGHQDVFDADSGRWSAADPATGFQTNGQFMLDCRFNTFHGLTGDEHIDLGGDAFIASNRFYSGSKDQWTIDTGYSNAISSGDKGTGTTIVVARNVFYDLDHAINCKINTATIFEHNTCVDFHQDWAYNHTVTQDVRCAAVNLYVPNDGNAAGDGAYVGYNIFYGNSVAPDDTVSPDPVGGFPRVFSWPDRNTTGTKTSVLRIENNFVDDRILDTDIGANHAGGLLAPAWGFGNVQGNPQFTDKAARDFSLQPDSPAKGKAAGGLDFGATIGEWVYLLNVPAPQTQATSANIIVGGPGIVAYKWRLDGGVWSAPAQIGGGGVMPRTGNILRQSSIILTNLTAGPHTLEVLGQDMAGNWQDADPARTLEGLPQAGPATATWTVELTQSLISLGELSANAANGLDWVELHNAGTLPVDLSGWSLTKTLPATSAVFLTPGTMIPAGGYVVVPLEGSPIGLDKDGDILLLLDAASALRDRISFGTQPQGYTLGRTAGNEKWSLHLPSPGAPNTPAAFSKSTATLQITEAMAASVISFKEDWVELCNSGRLAVDLSGLIFTDNRPGTAGSVIPPLSYIGPNACAVFLADKSVVPSGNHLNFALNSQQGTLALLSGSVVVDEILLYPQTDDWSQTRSPAGSTGWAELSTRGFNLAATDPIYLNALAIFRSLRITEIMYNAQGGSDFEWIELRNTGTTLLNLAGVHFDQGISFTFGDITLAGGKNIVLVKNPASFQIRYGITVNIGGSYTGNLDNSGETLALRLPAPFDANVLCFSYQDTWYPDTDGRGRTLTLLNNFTQRDDFGSSISWAESAALGGSPDGVTVPAPASYPQWKTFYGISSDTSDNDADTILPVMEFALGLDPLRPVIASGPAALPEAALSGGRLIFSARLPLHGGSNGGYGMPGITYRIEAGNELTGWTPLATKTLLTGWSGPATITLGTAADGFQPLSFTDPVLQTSPPHRFLRLAVSWIP